MKLLKEIGLNISEKAYRDLPYLSYSLLSSLDKEGPDSIGVETKLTDALLHGTIVDDKISGCFNHRDYHVSSNISIGDGIKKVVDILYENVLLIPNPDNKPLFEIEDYKELLINILKTQNIDYYSKKEPEWIANKVINDKVAKDYFLDLIRSKDKIIVTPNILNGAHNSYEKLKKNSFTKDIFNNNELLGLDKIYQLKYLIVINNYQFKGMLDRVIIDHTNKIIRPFDLKTGGKPAMEFPNSFFYWRYDLQAYIYTKICESIRDKYFPDYEIDNFKFVYNGRFENKPLIWEMPKEFMNSIYNGYTRNNRYYKGLKELISDFDWYKRQNFIVDFPEKIYNNNGIIKLDVSNIISNNNDNNRKK